MFNLTATALANELGLSRGRISQMVTAGQLDGCFEGDGRSRRFDLTLAQAKLKGTLDQGQMLGNGAKTKERLTQEQPKPAAKSAAAPPAQASEYELARTLKAVEEARKLRRNNAVEEGRYLLAAEVSRQVQGQIHQEIAEFESALRDGARIVADELDVDFKTVRKLLVDHWRAHRAKRVKVLEDQSEIAGKTDDEVKEDI